MRKQEYNVRLFAVNNGTSSGFTIYISFSGCQEVLMAHRHNGLLYDILKDGVRLEDFARMANRFRREPQRQAFCAAAQHIVRVALDYIRYERAIDDSDDERCA